MPERFEPSSRSSHNGRRRRGAWQLVIPLAVLVALAAPSVTFMLPATQDHLGEIYQPLQALKFFQSKGKAFHKYGPMPNFVLAPTYAASMAYWKLTGSFGTPSESFPYGFERPFQQLGFLIFQGRLIFLAIGVVGLGYLACTLQATTRSAWAVAFALLFCVATNYALLEQLPSPRPDSGMIGFTALALAVYVRMLFLGLTVRRGVWFSIWAVAAISSKELAGPLFVLPYLGLILLAWREGDTNPAGHDAARRTIRWSFVTGVAVYAMLNVVYSPGTWRRRMQFWLGGPGIDGDVWGHGGGPLGRAVGFAQCMLDNLGPGGAVVVPIAVVALLVARPRRWVMLLLPAVSVAVLGLSKIHYPADRFYTILCLALVLPVARGLDVLLARSPGGRARPLGAALLILGVVNVWFATFACIQHRGNFEHIAERHALARDDGDARIHLFNHYPYSPGSTRVEFLGLRHDPRSVQQMAAGRTNLPEWIYATRGKLQFFEDARRMPARAEMIREESGFDVAAWRGLEGLGYEHYETVTPAVPRWFPFEWMPAVKRWKALRAVEVYRLPAAATRVTTTPSTSP